LEYLYVAELQQEGTEDSSRADITTEIDGQYWFELVGPWVLWDTRSELCCALNSA